MKKRQWLRKKLLVMFAVFCTMLICYGGISFASSLDDLSESEKSLTIYEGETVTIQNTNGDSEEFSNFTKGWNYGGSTGLTLSFSSDSIISGIESSMTVDFTTYLVVGVGETECNITGVQEGIYTVKCITNARYNEGYGTAIVRNKNFIDTYTITVIGKRTVTFHSNGGSCEESQKEVWQYDAVGTLPTPQRENYDFLGWYTANSGGTKVTSATIVNSDVTYYAHWEKNIADVSFDANGGTVTTSKKEVKKKTAVGTLPTPQRKNYDFLGWYTAKSGGTKITSATIVNSNVKYYAHWIKSNVKITFHENGGQTNPKTKEIKRNSKIGTLPVAKKTKCLFDGWYTKKSGGIKVTASTVFASDSTVYARYKSAKPSKCNIVSLSAVPEKINVTIAPVNGAIGYEIKYADNSKMKKAKILKTTNTTTVLKSLKKGKKYYVKVRAMTKDSLGNTVYGAYGGTKKITVPTVMLNTSNSKCLKGQTISLKLLGAKKGIKWSSSKKSVAAVDKNGKIKAKKKGTATITATYKNKKYKCKITVEDPKLSQKSFELIINNRAYVTLTKTSFPIIYKSEDPRVATVDNTGMIIPCNIGTTRIFAIANGKKFLCKVTVNAVKEFGNNHQNTGNNNNTNNGEPAPTGKVYEYGKFKTTAGFAHVKDSGWENKKAPVTYSRLFNNDWFEIDLSDSAICKGFSFVNFTGCSTGKTFVDKNFNPVYTNSSTGTSTYSTYVILNDPLYNSDWEELAPTIRSDTRMGETQIRVNKIECSDIDETGTFTIYFDIDYSCMWQGSNPDYERHIEGFMAIPNYVEPTEIYCMQCYGTGRCPLCDGRGEILGTHTTCTSCKGNRKCKYCGGDGVKGIMEK